MEIVYIGLNKIGPELSRLAYATLSYLIANISKVALTSRHYSGYHYITLMGRLDTLCMLLELYKGISFFDQIGTDVTKFLTMLCS